MKVKIGGMWVSFLDSHVKSFKTKDAFLKDRIKHLEHSDLTEEQIKKVSEEMYDTLVPPKKTKED